MDTERETYSDRYGPICPYCDYQQEASDDAYELYDEDTTEWYCINCEKEFGVRVIVNHSWMARRL